MRVLFRVFLLTFILFNVTPVQSNPAQSKPFNSNLTFQESLVAINDLYTLLIDCNNDVLTGNLLDNDLIVDPSSVEVAHVVAPQIGMFSCGPAGNFVFIVHEYFDGIVEFSYRIQDKLNHDLYSDAFVKIAIRRDSDCDHVYDLIDLDCDNDGILNFLEGMGEVDSDNDGIPDSFDIDSDNDGITDLEEWQKENSVLFPSHADVNEDGWDDAYDSYFGGDYYEPVDTDQDGIPDFQDTDSDNDSIPDFYEALDLKSREAGDKLTGLDCDYDGLDDYFDTISCCAYQTLTICSSAALPDSNDDNIRDWRDPNNSTRPGTNQDIKNKEYLALVYPNPVNESCTVVLQDLEINTNQAFEVKLYSASGQLLLQQQKQETSFVLDLNQLTQGIYILNAAVDGLNYKSRIVKN